MKLSKTTGREENKINSNKSISNEKSFLLLLKLSLQRKRLIPSLFCFLTDYINLMHVPSDWQKSQNKH